MRTIHLVLDNFKIHSTRRVEKFLEQQNSRIALHFLPPYCPNDNPIERFWRDLHGEVTRNHQCRTLPELLRHVGRFMRRSARARRAAVAPDQSIRDASGLRNERRE